MSRLTLRLARLEREAGDYCTLGEIFDALDGAERGEAWPQLRPMDPRLNDLLANMEDARTRDDVRSSNEV